VVSFFPVSFLLVLVSTADTREVTACVATSFIVVAVILFMIFMTSVPVQAAAPVIPLIFGAAILS
jgi:Na+-translocating ferredoxin:NAD+ oxidoreductase RnfD subunit